MIRIFITLTIILLGCGTASHKSRTMSMDELLSKERDQYMANYRLGLAQNKTDKSTTEIMLQMTADLNRSEPEIFQLNRYDMVTVNAQGKFDLTEFNLPKDSVLKFDEEDYNNNGVKVEISPFVWNGCEFTIDKRPTGAFEIWARKWIDINDNKKVAPDSFLNVIHSVTFPTEENGKWTTSVDFGSAPIDAFKELLEVFSKQQGVKTIQVHSKTFLK